MSIVFYLALLLLLVFPSANYQLFDGLPLSRLPEFAAFLLIVPFLIWGGLRQQLERRMARWKLHPACLWGALLLALAIKILLLSWGSFQGFLGCYRSPAAPANSYRGPAVSLPCERSYENPFLRFGVTRVDPQVDFSSVNWNLAFINSARYDYYDWQPGNVERDRLPLEATWNGIIQANSGDRLIVNYVGSGEVIVGAQQVDLPPSYRSAGQVSVPLAAGRSTLEASYRFDDGSRSGQNPSTWGPRAAFALLQERGAEKIPLGAAAPAVAWRIGAGGSDAILAACLLLLLLILTLSLGKELLGLAGVGVAIALIVSLPLSSTASQLALSGILGLVLLVHWRLRKLSPLLRYGLVAAASIAFIREAYPTWTWVVLRSAGNDGLMYESIAQSLWLTSFRPGTVMLGSAPYFPYVTFLEHFLFGDGDVLYASLLLALTVGGVFFAWDQLAPPGHRGWRALTSLVIAACLLIGAAYYASGVIRAGLSEPPGWALALWSLPLLLRSVDRKRLSLGLVGLASTFGIRTNWFLGILGTEGLAIYRGVRARGLRPWIGFGLAGALLVIPFWWVVTQPQLAINEVLGPSSVPLLLRGDQHTWLTLISQLRYLLFAVKLSASLLPVAVSAHLLLVAWLGTFVVAGRRGTWFPLLMLAAPALYLLPHVALEVVTYYPRHVFTGYLVVGVVTLAYWGGHLELRAKSD